jgi:hypothetical protein
MEIKMFMKLVSMPTRQRPPAGKDLGRRRQGGQRLTLFLLIVCSLPLSGCQVVNPILDLFREKRTPEMYVLPSDFQGWALVEWNVPNAEAVEVKDGHQLVRVPRCGYVAYSTPFDFGWALDRVFVEHEDGRLVEHLEGKGEAFVFRQSIAATKNPEPGDRSVIFIYFGPTEAMTSKTQKNIDDFPRGQPCE